MVIDRPQDLTGQAIDRAVGEVATSVGFIQHIGGDLTHICQWIQDQPKIVEDLDQVFGEQTSPFEVAAAAARLAERFAAAGRPDLERLTLDTALLMAAARAISPRQEPARRRCRDRRCRRQWLDTVDACLQERS